LVRRIGPVHHHHHVRRTRKVNGSEGSGNANCKTGGFRWPRETGLSLLGTVGAAAFVTGALMRIGPNRLRLDVRVQDAASGQVLLAEKVEGGNIDAVFKTVDSDHSPRGVV
jgi:hypothetical protein